MKILYAIQGTGNGHVSRAKEIIPYLKQHGELDLMLSGNQVDIDLHHPVKYNKRGVSFIFGTKGGIDYWSTFKNLKTKTFVKEVLAFPIESYDLIINDFEPITAWAAHLRKINCVSFSHQCSFLSYDVPRPEETERFGEFILKNYAPCQANVGLHFQSYDNFIYPPIIRKEIRNLEPTNEGHYTVYLPSYNDENLINVLGRIKSVEWEIFSKHTKQSYQKGNVKIYPVSTGGFNKSLTSATGLLTGAGFESPAEALYLGKKLMVIPMHRQYEQQCNAAALKKMGVPVIHKLQDGHEEIKNWIYNSVPIKVDYPDQTEKLVEDIVHQKITTEFFSTRYTSV